VSIFKQHRKMEHRDGTFDRGLAAIKKTIYSIGDLREVLLRRNRRYLDYLSTLDNVSAGQCNLTPYWAAAPLLPDGD
jgi:hypothetical protein